MIELIFDKSTIEDISNNYFHHHEIAFKYFIQIFQECIITLDDYSILPNKNNSIGDLTKPPSKLSLFYQKQDLLFNKILQKFENDSRKIKSKTIRFVYELESEIEFSNDEIYVRGKEWKIILKYFTFTKNFDFEKCYGVNIDDGSPIELKSFNDFPDFLPPTKYLFYVDRFADLSEKKSNQLNSNIIRFIKKQSDFCSHMLNIIIYTSINENAEDKSYEYFDNFEFLLSKIDNLDFNLQLIIEKEKHDVHDRLILTDFYLVHFGDSFNFFFNNNEVDELDRRAKLSFVTFESFLKSNYYYKNLSIREWFKEKIQNNPDNYILRGKGIDYLLNS